MSPYSSASLNFVVSMNRFLLRDSEKLSIYLYRISLLYFAIIVHYIRSAIMNFAISISDSEPAIPKTRVTHLESILLTLPYSSIMVDWPFCILQFLYQNRTQRSKKTEWHILSFRQTFLYSPVILNPPFFNVAIAISNSNLDFIIVNPLFY